MKALLHYNTRNQPIGLWYAEGDRLRSIYPEPTLMESRARAFLESKVPSASWDDMFVQVGRRQPNIDNFVLVEVDPESDLEAFLASRSSPQ